MPLIASTYPRETGAIHTQIIFKPVTCSSKLPLVPLLLPQQPHPSHGDQTLYREGQSRGKWVAKIDMIDFHSSKTLLNQSLALVTLYYKAEIQKR